MKKAHKQFIEVQDVDGFTRLVNTQHIEQIKNERTERIIFLASRSAFCTNESYESLCAKLHTAELKQD